MENLEGYRQRLLLWKMRNEVVGSDKVRSWRGEKSRVMRRSWAAWPCAKNVCDLESEWDGGKKETNDDEACEDERCVGNGWNLERRLRHGIGDGAGEGRHMLGCDGRRVYFEGGGRKRVEINVRLKEEGKVDRSYGNAASDRDVGTASGPTKWE
jgi:hypothetical protein